MADPVAELTEHFSPAGKELENDVFVVLQSMMKLHQLSPQDLFYKWEAYCLRLDQNAQDLAMDRLRAFKQDLQDALERSNRAQAQVRVHKGVTATPRAMNKGGDVYGMLEGLVPTTPGTGKLNKSSTKKRHAETPLSRVKAGHPGSSPDSRTPSKIEEQLNSLGAIPSVSFNDRPNAGEVIEVLNEHLPVRENPFAPFAEPRIKLTAASDQKKLVYKPLVMKLSEASEILDDRIDDFMHLVREHHGLEDSAFGSAASQSTSEIVAVGRIASDSAEGRLNAASLVLETSRRTGAGLRVSLDMGAVPQFHFFPGQIVALQGSNTSGNSFTVKKILDMPLLDSAASPPTALEAHAQRLRGGPDAMDSDTDPAPLAVMYASGPYTADDNLDFEPLHALCSQAADTCADALVLTGPFIDSEHPLIATGDFDLPDEAVNVDPDTATMNTVFKYMFAPALNRLISSNPFITVILIPSVRDVIDKHVSWPQDTFPRRDLGLPKSVRIVGNPMTLSMNEVVVGLSSQDALYELRSEELLGGAQAGGLLERVCRYLIEQRHFFPLFPPADRKRLPKVGTEEGIPPGAMLDVSYLKLGEFVGVRPDVLVVPSALPPFAKVIESVLVINPGFLSKRRGAGTYARMLLHPLNFAPEDAGDGGLLGHGVFRRARVEITRI